MIPVLTALDRVGEICMLLDDFRRQGGSFMVALVQLLDERLPQLYGVLDVLFVLAGVVPLHSHSLDVEAEWLLFEFLRLLGLLLFFWHFDQDLLVAAGWMRLKVDCLETRALRLLLL